MLSADLKLPKDLQNHLTRNGQMSQMISPKKLKIKKTTTVVIKFQTTSNSK